MTSIEAGYVSADGHVVEPADLWTTRIDKQFRDRAPRVESRTNGDYYLIDGFEPIPVGLEGVAIDDKIAGKIKSAQGYRHAATRPGAWDPRARLADQDLDHVRAEVLYPGLGLFITSAPDPAYVRACYQAYNEWLSEFCMAAATRLLGAALLPMRGPIEWALEEAERAAKRGLRSVMIPTEVANRSYSEPEYDSAVGDGARPWPDPGAARGNRRTFHEEGGSHGCGQGLYRHQDMRDAARDGGPHLGCRSPAVSAAALRAGRRRYWMGGLSAAVDGSLVGRSSSLDGAQGG